MPWNPLVLPGPGRPVPVGPARALGQPAHRPHYRHCHRGSHQGRHQVPTFITVLRIRIHFHFGRLDPDQHWEYGSGSRRAKINHKSEENSSFKVLDALF